MPPSLEQKTPTSVGMETPTETSVRARRMLEPSISANDLANPPQSLNVPEPLQPPVPNIRMAENVGREVERFIGDNLQSRRDLENKMSEFSALTGGETMNEMFQSQLEQFGATPETIKELQDIQLQLARRTEDSAVRKSRIENAPGQTMAQAQREVTQESREEAIRSAGLASRASVLQGNINTAREMANQAVQLAYQDRQFHAQNMLQQINMLQGQVDRETSQLLQREQRAFQEDLRQTERIEQAVDSAMKTGDVSSNEIAMLTSPNTTDGERLALAQLIQARSAGEMRDMDMQARELDMAVKAEQLAKLREPKVATRQTDIIEVGGQKQLVDTQTGDVLATFGADVSNDEIITAKKTQFATTIDSLRNHPGMAKAVGPTAIQRWTPFRVDVMSGQVSDFTGSLENVVKTLTLNTYAEAKERGMTFGAMSEAEWDILGQSATQIAQWRRERDDGSIYYAISEKKMNEELDKLGQFAKADALRAGANPAELNVLQTDDGLYWGVNSDGSYSTIPYNP